MKLPNYRGAVVPERKVRDYLLSSTHLHGRHKAKFFRRFGFSVDRWPRLVDALRNHAAEGLVVDVQDTAYGKRYIVEGGILAPDGREPRIRSVWFIETGESAPRLVTVFPS